MASATMLATVIAVGGVGMLGYDLSGGAPGSGAGITACSAQPTTCSAAEVENWVYRATGARTVLPAAGPTINPFEHSVGLPGDVSVYRTLYTDDVSIDVVMSPGQPVRTLFRGVHADPQTSSAVSGYPGLTKFTSTRGSAPDAIDYTAWGAEPRPGAGSVLVVYAGPDSHMPSDRDVAELIHGLRGE
ncbi:hypothetical protein IEE94_15325 [Yimella sp. cx-573]|nr:hypothetical protein [Yimella sp. cx-573]